jgi:signal transduction histidine kinase
MGDVSWRLLSTGKYQALSKLDELAGWQLAIDRSAVVSALTVGDDHVLLSVNSAFCQAFGRTATALTGLGLSTLFEEPGPMHALLDAVAASGITQLAHGIAYGGRGASRSIATVIVQPISDARARRRGSMISIIDTASPAIAIPPSETSMQILQDANERLTLTSLREQERADDSAATAAQVKALIETMNEGVAVFGADGEVVLMNPVARTMLGVTDDRPDMDDYRLCSLQRTDGTMVDFDRDLLAPIFAGDGFRDHELLVGPDHRRIVVSSSVVRDDVGMVLFAITTLTDVTKMRELEQVRERYVSLISHDLRGPLSAATLASEMIETSFEDAAHTRKLGAVIGRQLVRMDQMLRDLLDAQRLRSGEAVPVELGTCDLKEVASDLVAELTLKFGDRFALEAELPVRGWYGCNELRRALWNLATNAIKYGSATTPVTLRVVAEAGRVLLSVHNEGLPIAPEDRVRMFAAYSRLAPMVTSVRGWGLGLTLVRGCAEAHGGTVRVASDAESGTLITIDVPLVSSRPAN